MNGSVGGFSSLSLLHIIFDPIPIKKSVFSWIQKDRSSAENRPEIQITRISTRGAAPVSAAVAAGEPVYDACAPVSTAGAEPVSRAPLSAGEPVLHVPVSLPGHTADSVSGSGLAVAAERRAPLRHSLPQLLQ